MGNGKARFVPLKWVAAGSGFSLIFSLTAKAWPKPTEHQTAQYTAPAAQKMTVKHGKTGLETRKTGSSPVLSTIKLNQKRYQREKPRSFNDFRVFLRPIFEVEKKISKRVLAKSVDLNLYPRHFEPLFREFFGKAARFCSRKNVEFRPTFLVALPNTHSKHRFQRVSQLCDVSDVKTAGKPQPIPLQDENTAYWRCWDARKQSTRCQFSGWSFICWLSAEHRFLMSHPSCPCGLRGYPDRAVTRRSMRSECGSDQTQRAYSRADGAAPGDSAHV